MPQASPEKITDAMREAIWLLRTHHVPHMLIGALAVSVWGRERATTDLDILIAVSEQELELLSEKAGDAGFVRDTTWETYNPLLKLAMRRFRRRGVSVDLLLPRDVHDHQAIERRKRKDFAGIRLSVVSAEDLIIQKLKTGRPRDLDDASSVFERQGKRLDLAYLRRWARRLGITAELKFVAAHRGQG